MMIRIPILEDLQLYDLSKVQLDLIQISNRRFMYHSSGLLILGDEKKGKGLLGSHAEEYGILFEKFEKGLPPYDEFIRGWIGVGGRYKNGIIHFSPSVNASFPYQFNSAYDFVQAALRNGFTGKSILRGFGETWEQKISKYFDIPKQPLTEILQDAERRASPRSQNSHPHRTKSISLH